MLSWFFGVQPWLFSFSAANRCGGATNRRSFTENCVTVGAAALGLRCFSLIDTRSEPLSITGMSRGNEHEYFVEFVALFSKKFCWFMLALIVDERVEPRSKIYFI